MTREEAKKQATHTRYHEVYDVNSSLNEPKFSLIDEIYNDFANQICKNCDELQRDFNNTCAIGISIPEDENGYTDITFGCNNFQDLI